MGACIDCGARSVFSRCSKCSTALFEERTVNHSRVRGTTPSYPDTRNGFSDEYKYYSSPTFGGGGWSKCPPK
jgi:hypothetical protein